MPPEVTAVLIFVAAMVVLIAMDIITPNDGVEND